jgi:hypothetical protein
MNNPLDNEALPFLATRKFHWTLIIAISVFLVLFLLLFLPFGINEPKKEFNLIFIAQMSLFGWIIFFTLLMNEYLIRRRFIRQWTLRTFLLWTAWTFFSTGTMNFLLYNYLQSWYDMYWSSYVRHVLNVSTVEIFPIAGVFYFFRHRELKQKIQKLNTVKTTQNLLSTPITLSGAGEQDRITLELQQILYIESDDNYAILHYLENEGRKKHIMRSTLSALEEANYPFEFLLRIHRSFLVNAYLVESISGNVQRSKVKLRRLEDRFPVSRSYVHQVRDRLCNL